MLDQTRIGRLIREARERKRLSQRELAGKLGIARSRLSAGEAGKSYLGDEIYLKIFQILGISPSLLSDVSAGPLEMESFEIENLVSEFRLLAQRKPELAQDFLKMARDAEDAKKIKHPFVDEMVSRKLDEVRRFFSEAGVGVIELEEPSIMEITGTLLETARERIWATSSLDPKIWWHGPLGEEYQKINIRMATQQPKLSIQRIFIFASAEECQVAKEIILDQIRANIRIWAGFSREFPPGLATDLLIVDDRVTAWQSIKDRVIIESVRFSTKSQDLARAVRIYERMKIYCSNDGKAVEDDKQLANAIEEERKRQHPKAL